MTEKATESIQPKSILEWNKWLERNHSRANGIWLITFKQATGRPRISYDDAVESALCFGWIDSKPRTLDAERSMLWFSPRKKGSAWSKRNKERVEKLVAANRLHEAGLAKIEDAKQDGSWIKLDSVEALVHPNGQFLSGLGMPRPKQREPSESLKPQPWRQKTFAPINGQRRSNKPLTG